MSTRINAFINGLILAGAMMFFITSTLIVGPYIEGKYFPITTDIRVTDLKTDTTSHMMTFHVYGNKVRDCSLLDIRTLVTQGNNYPIKGAIWVIDDGQGQRERAKGMQDMGIWAIQPEGDKVTIEGTYHCHPLWNTKVNIGEWHK